MRSIIVLVWFCNLAKISMSQELYEVPQPGLEDCYCIDTYKTDFEPRDELVRQQRSFFKKLFKKWGKKWLNDDCVQCCQNNAGYDGGSAGDGNAYTNSYNTNDYNDDQQYDNGYQPLFSPPDIPAGHHGHIYLPLPHPHRVMSHLQGYFNRPFRRGYGGKMGGSGNYPPKEAYVEEKPVVAPVEETNPTVYEEPAAVEESESTYTEKPAYTSEEKESEEKKDDKDDKDDYSSKSDYKDDKKDEKLYAAQSPVITQIIQPIVPILAPPMYVYQPQYYSPPSAYMQPMSYMQPHGYQNAVPSSTYSPSAPSYSSYTSPASTSYSPPAASYSPIAPSYSPPISSYSPPPPSYSSHSEPASPYSSVESYSPPLNPSDYNLSPNYYKRTYSTSLTYLLPPTSYSSAPQYPCYENDQPMKSCPELFTSYGDAMGTSESTSQPY